MTNELNTLLVASMSSTTMESAIMQLTTCDKKKFTFTNHTKKIPSLPLLHGGNLEKQVAAIFTLPTLTELLKNNSSKA